MKIATSTIGDLYKPEALEEFQIITALEPEVNLQVSLIRQLIEKSKQVIIHKSVPKDASDRFSDINAYRRWSANGKLLFALMGEDDDLGGVIWFSEKFNSIAPEVDSTFAIRLYDNYRQKGLAKPFMSLAHFLLPRVTEMSGNAWLETDRDNVPAQKLYEDFGYRYVGVSETGRLVMAYTGSNE